MKLKLLLILVSTYFLSSCMNSTTKHFIQGKAEFEHGEYNDAIEHLKQSTSDGQANKGESAFYIAESYRQSNRIYEAEKYYRIAKEEEYQDEHIDFYYAYAMKANGKYKSAAIQFQKYVKSGDNDEYIELAKQEIKNIKALSKIWRKRGKYKIENLEEINTDGIEYSPMMLFEELYFTSSRGEGPTFSGQGTRFTDIYRYKFDGGSRFSGQVYKINDIINQEATHEATTTFSKDGRTMIFSRSGNGKSNDITKEVDLFISYFEEGEWTKAERLDISESYSWDSNPFLKGDTLYFASNREGGEGGDDIWYSVLFNGEWSEPENMGGLINTLGDEQFPYISPDEKFYFSSDGHVGFGEMDLFKIKKLKGKKTVENLGRPINSTHDDISICFVDGKKGYFASNRLGGKGDDDIYAFFYDCKIRYEMQLLVLGDELDHITHVPTGKKIPLKGVKVDVFSGNTKLLTTNSNDSGYVIFPTDSDTKYTFKVRPKGYLANETNCTAPTKVSEDDVEDCSIPITETCQVSLTPILNQLEIEFNPILYKYNKWDILPESEVILTAMVKVMKDNPTILVELGSHTDARGSVKYNDILSQKRAESAVEWIISHGVSSKRIAAKGYGERVPRTLKRDTAMFKTGTVLKEILINTYEKTDSILFELGHQMNRRTEFRVVGVIAEEMDVRHIKVVDDGSGKDEGSDKIKQEHEAEIIKKTFGDNVEEVEYEKK